jgi:predicted nucleic acid-binding protein
MVARTEAAVQLRDWATEFPIVVARTEAAVQLRDWATEFPIVAAEPGALWTALEIAVDGRFGLWDALLLATVERHGCEILLSEDMQDGIRFGGVTILDPFIGGALPERVAALLR